MISKNIILRTAYYPDSLSHYNTKTSLSNIIANAPNHEVNGYNSEDVKVALRKIYNDKCAFCESVWAGSSFVRIDHFRPKKYLKGVSKKKHYGYYWLALEWTNLISSCEACNNAKSNHFTLEDDLTRVDGLKREKYIIEPKARTIDGDILKGEKRLLLHPELDQVEDHLLFLPNGKVTAKNGSKMGEKSIEIFGLNRGDLLLQRKKIIDKNLNKLISIFNDYEDRGADEAALIFLKHDLKNYFKELLSYQEVDQTFSRLGFYMFHHFQSFFINSLPDELIEHREIVEHFYKRIKNHVII